MFQASPVMKKASIGFACLNIKVRRLFGVPPLLALSSGSSINAAVTGMAGRQMRGIYFKPTAAHFGEVSQPRGAVYARGGIVSTHYCFEKSRLMFVPVEFVAISKFVIKW